MAEGLTKKRRIRAGHRGVVTKRLAEVNGLMGTEGGEDRPRPDSLKLAQLQMALKEKLEVLKQLDGEILDLLASEEDIATEIEQADDYNHNIYEALVRMEEVLTPTGGNGRSSPGSRSGTEGGAAETSPTQLKAKLPELTLRKFDGDIIQWVTFWDAYKSAIHTNAKLSNIDKYTYLQSLLEGSAREAISGLPLTSDNYEEAISILEARFGDKQRIIHRHMDILLGIDAVTSIHNLTALRKLYDKVETNVRSLDALGVASDSYGSILSSVLIKKLPNELRLLVSRKLTGEWTLSAILKELSDELRARERMALATPTTKDGGLKRTNHLPTAAALMSGSRNAPATACCCCQNEHPSDKCDVVKSVEERRRVLRTTGRCYICLRKGHVSRTCRARGRCQQCSGRHHTSICGRPESSPRGGSPRFQSRNESAALNPSATPFTGTPTSSTACCCTGKTIAVLMQTAQATVFDPANPGRRKKVAVLFDSGSQHSYVTTEVKDFLDLKGKGRRLMSIMTFGATKKEPLPCEQVEIGICGLRGPGQVLAAFTVPLICEPIRHSPVQTSICKLPELSDLQLADPSCTGSLQPDVLIGLDHYWKFFTGEMIYTSEGPVAMKTRLGWVISGPMAGPIEHPTTTGLITHVLKVGTASPEERNKRLERQLSKFWELESLGIVDQECSVYEQFADIVHFHQGRYEVLLPWKDASMSIPDNYRLCLRRLHNLLKRLYQNTKLLEQYDDVITQQARLGIIEPVEAEMGLNRQIHYLPHHGVFKQDKQTTKLRIVYDASARNHGPSLNDCLHVGPKFNQKILEILLRFRVHNVALVGDIEKAFLMIGVSQKDRDVLRFLWVKDIKRRPPEICAYRFTRVVFGVACSPFLLNATLRHHINKYQATRPDLVSQLNKSIYVDDVILGARTADLAFEICMDSRNLLQQGGFNLRKFLTNDDSLQERIMELEDCVKAAPPDADSPDTYARRTLGQSQSTLHGETKVLGVRWDTQADELVFDLVEITNAARRSQCSKRHVVSTIGRFYDPLGIISPVLTPFKVFLQQLCKAKIAWDELLSGDLLREWNRLIGRLEGDVLIRVPRCYTLSHEEESEHLARLIGFCDASIKAYAAVIYLVTTIGEVTYSRLVCSKTRIAPLKEVTIPRLELLSALLLARLVSNVSSSLEGELVLLEPLCFTDSKVSYYWIKGNDKSWKPFVQNRVSEIRRLVPTDRWRHCPGELNPADLPSRGLALNELCSNSFWFEGPGWLKCGWDNQLVEEVAPDLPQECSLELRKPMNCVSETMVTLTTNIDMAGVVPLERYSGLAKLLSVSAYVLLFIRRLRNCNSSLVEMMEEARRYWVREAQAMLQRDAKFEMWLKQLNLFLDSQEIWRCGGRFHNAELPYSTKFPIVLPSKHRFTELVVQHSHERVFHNGVKETLTEIRSQYWIIRGRQIVQRIVQQCITCRRLEALAYRAPPPPPLPPFRVTEAPPFTYVGLDFAGPLFVKANHTPAPGSKAWICLFTCCVTRGIHLDLVPDLTTESFIRCLKRFVARRGVPRQFLSDNGKTFKAAAHLLSMSNRHSVRIHLAPLKIKWIFNVERAPWWGGIFERMVRSTKRCLKKVVGQARLSFEELLTILHEVEMIVNCRPLSFVSISDLEEPLTPSHLMCGRRLMNVPGDTSVDSDDEGTEDATYQVTPHDLTKRTRLLDKMLSHFWKRWKSEYLLELRQSHSRKLKTSGRLRISNGDMVIVEDERVRRPFWKLGLVEQTIAGRDGQVRAAIVRVGDSGKGCKLLRRPLQHLYPLEISRTGEVIPRDSGEDSSDPSPDLEPQAEVNGMPGHQSIDQPQEDPQVVDSDLVDANVVDSAVTHGKHSDGVYGDATRNSDDADGGSQGRPKRKAAVLARDRIVAQTLD